ncbi:MAG: hypothetical protein ACOYU5_04755 [Stygiobacter sp.]
MKINTNVIGNYSTPYVKHVSNENRQVENKVITNDEKKFFSDLYPARKEEVMNYQFYNAKGKVSGLHVGSLFDKRG